MTKDQKETIDRYVQIYLSGLQAVSNDAGWEGLSFMGRVVEFAGDLPPPSGNDQSNLAMINAIRLLRRRHAKWPVISGAVSLLLRERRQEIVALLARHYYVGECPRTSRPWTDIERAGEIGQEFNEYRYNIGKAYHSMLRELTVAEEYRRVFAQNA